jgi:hypothetical protein
MRPHPYLRAYMAGIVVPTIGLWVAVMAFATARYGFGVELSVERALIFPLAIVPNAWGGWNVLHLIVPAPARLPLALHGAVLPLILMPAGLWLANSLAVFEVDLSGAVLLIAIGIGIYYLLWKHVVAVLNSEVGIA